MAQGPRRACPPAACSPSRPGWSSSASASGWRSAPPSYWDVDGHLRDGRRATPAPFTATLVARRRRAGRHRPRLRRPTRRGSARPRASCTSTRRRATALAARPRAARPFAVARRRGEAVHAPAGRAVHHLDAAAGGRPQAALLGAADDARGAVAVRERLHHLHAYRLDEPVGAGARRGPPAGRASSTAPSTCPTEPRHVRDARSRTRRRRTRRSARPATPSARPAQVAGRAARRRVPALRADLEAHGRLPDGRRARARRRPSGSARRPPTAATPSSARPAPSSPSAASSPPTRRAGRRPSAERADGRRAAALPPLASGDALDAARARRRRPRDHAAAALHRGEPGQGARGARHRPPVDVRVDHRDDPGPRLRVRRRARRSCRPGWRSR